MIVYTTITGTFAYTFCLIDSITCDETLQLECVAGLQARIYLPITNPIQREVYRRHAHFLANIPNSRKLATENTNTEEYSAPQGISIRSNANLKPTDLSKPITAELRATGGQNTAISLRTVQSDLAKNQITSFK